MDKLEEQLTKEKLHENDSKTTLTALMTSFQSFFSEWPMYTTLKTRDDFRKYTGKDIQIFKDIMIHDIEWEESKNNNSENALSKSVNEILMQMQEGNVNMGKALDTRLVVTKSSGTKSDKQDTSSGSGNDTTQAVHANIKPVNDQEPLANVQLTAQHSVLANEQQHTKQYEPIYDTYLVEKVDSNTTPDSTNMRNNRGKTDQDGEQYLAKSPLPAFLIDQPTTD
ncbi:hypothetical protein Tco_1175045 [Tanacetum coccineum]